MIQALSEISFKNREDAATKLVDVLPKDQMQNDDWLIVAVSTQAVPIANEVAKKLNLYYDLLFFEHICAPNNSKCTIGMVSETEEIVLHNELVDSFGINLDFIYGEAHRRYEEKILPKVYKYRKGDLIGSLEGKNVLLVDEGCETGMTIMTAVKTVINGGAKSVAYATPILSNDVAISLEPVTDEIFSVHKVINFVDVDFYYQMLKELDTEDVLEIISNSKNYLPFQKRGEK
ncbi:phosphoribosyltransferase [Sulfurospirillum arcachonense]|uniref:phosphoribosyltransferase n=1 Tax=Sulfurospirillum arcachonense TaxID=57666 RepID=UPI000469FF16|nr:phosphoribosyltransferase family protein [Sulfurospirillum arcachonense]